jgi:CHAT domain-containing protein/Tfp pilus assembly protein PilF
LTWPYKKNIFLGTPWDAKVIFKRSARFSSFRPLFLIFIAVYLSATPDGQHSHSIYRSAINQGLSLRQAGEFLKAIEIFDRTLRIAGAHNDATIQLECLMNLGILNWDIGKIKESDDLFGQALALSQKIGLKEQEARCSAYLAIYDAYVLGKEACASGAYQESIKQFNTAIDLAQKIDSPEHELKCLRQMSLNYYQIESFSTFFSLNERGLNIAKKLQIKKEEGRCLNNMGLYHLLICDYAKALIFFKEAWAILSVLENREQEASECLSNIGLAYSYLGYFEKALPYLDQALEIDSYMNNKEEILADLNNVGATYSRKGRAHNNLRESYASLDYYQRSLDLANETNNIRLKVEILNNIGLLFGRFGYQQSAIRYFKLAIQEAIGISYVYEACNIYANMGFALFKSKKFRESKESFDKSIKLAKDIDRNEVLWEAYLGLGQCLEQKGQYELALGCYRKALSTVDFMRSRLALDDFKTGFIQEKVKVYEALLSLLSNEREKLPTTGLDEQIFEVMEKAKARAFLEELERTDLRTSKSNDNPLRNVGEDLSKKISLTVSELVSPSLGEGPRQKLLDRLEIEEDEYTNLLNRIKTEEADSIGIASPWVISATEMKEKYLDEKTALLEFFLGENRSFGVLISRHSFIQKNLPSRAVIEDSLRAYLKLLSTPPKEGFQGIPAARRIYRDLLFPFESAITDGIDHLILVPDGILHYLPFETLVRDNPMTHEPQYLIEFYDISYAPSASSLAYLMSKGPRAEYKKMLLAVGDPAYPHEDRTTPRGGRRYENALRDIYLDQGFELSSLPHSRKEVHRVARCFPRRQVDVLLESQAKEEDIKSRPLEEYRIIHFACHGFLDERIPMRSALVLTLDDDVEEDGFLQAREIANLKLKADLVVLSACQTGRGRLENAEGVFGLPRAFFYAGARSTISSLWKISDESTAEIMPELYRRLASGDTKVRSLRQAKLKMLKSRFSHPFYWAAFILQGDYL